MKTCVLFSGGWDSAAATLKHLEEKPDLLFIRYGQSYLGKELHSATLFALKFDLKLVSMPLELTHDQRRRNLYMIAEAHRLGYERIIVGSRNLAPIFDKYRDSNWLSLKVFALLMGISVVLPVTGWRKKRIVKFVRRFYSRALYNCYLNQDSYRHCHCSNCTEMRNLL